MSVRIYLKDNTDGNIHEYGTNPHDALYLTEDGSLHYENLQNGDGTSGGGYSFCALDGKPPDDQTDRIVDIGGERTGVNCHQCRWRNRHQKCSCCKRNPSIKDCYELDRKKVDEIRKKVLGW